MSKSFTVLVALATLLIVPPSAADGGCGYTTSDSVEAGVFHVAVDDGDVWVYEETNGFDGLQRKDGARDDTAGCIAADTFVL